MLDTKAILETIKSGIALSSNAQSKLSGQFTQSASSMSLSGGEGASSVMGSSAEACQQMSTQMNKAFASLQNDLEAHQKMQQQEQPENFHQTMEDLREMTAKGFPNEDRGFLNGKKKI